MSSILTNNSAMVALQTLKSINMNLGKVQSEISTGKTVESAKDNAAVWAISKVMSSDVKGFEAISDSLALGQATVGVAVNGAETITDLLTEVKGKIVNAQESNVDREKIQTDIDALTNQISSIVGAAQFNGLNLLNGSDTADVDILSSLDRAADGSVTAGQISVGRTDLRGRDELADRTALVGSGTLGGRASAALTAATANVVAISLGNGTTAGAALIDGVAFSLVLSAGTVDYSTIATTGGGTGANAESSEITYVAKEGDTAEDIGNGLANAYNAWAEYNGFDELPNALVVAGSGTGLTITTAGTGVINVEVNTNVANGTVAHKQGGGELSKLGFIDVTTAEGANLALGAIEDLIQKSINTAAELGSSSKQIDTQAEFVGKLSDLLTSGIGTLVDADMEAASAKLQALQTQQQLGVQALSIANQAPQTILSLFR